MTILFRNNAVSTLANPVLTTDTLVVLATNTGSRFPAPVAGEWFYATIQSGVNYEIVKCTARAGDVLTVERAQDGTSLQSWNAGASIDMRIPKIVLESFLQQNEIAKVAAGSAATPSLTFTGDSDTGIFNPAPNEIGFSTAGAEKLRLDSLGNVGIGTTGPSSKLEVVGSITTRGAVPEVKYLETDTGTVIRTLVDGSAWDVRRDDYSVLLSINNSNGQIRAGQTGTAAAPAYSFTGDSDTGIFNLGPNEIGFSLGGTERLRLQIGGLTYTAGSNVVQILSDGAIEITRGSGGAYIDFKSAAGEDADARIAEFSNGLAFITGGNGALVGRVTIPGAGAISMVGPVNVTSGGQTVTGDLEASGNLRFNSGYGSAAIAYGVRAWANIDGTTLVNANGTYSQSGTTVTVSLTNHGLIVGHLIHADITSGAGVDGFYTVASVVDANTFTYIAGTSLTTSGNVSLPRCVVRGAGNISNVVRVSTGDYAVNFAAAMPDANYMAIANVSHSSAGANATVAMMWTAGRFAAYCRFGCSDNNTDGYSNAAQIDFMVMR